MCMGKKELLDFLQMLLLPIAIFLAIMLYLFGGLEAIVNKNQDVYKDLITSSFTLAGLAIAAIAFAIKQEPKIVKLLIWPTILFLLAGLFMYANIIVGELFKFNINLAGFNMLYYVFATSYIIGGVGIGLFFTGLILLVIHLRRIYSSLQ